MSRELRKFEPQDPNFEQRVRESFARQQFLTLLGAELARLEPGHIDVVVPLRPELTQQNGYGHAGVTTTIADVAGGYAAASLHAADRDVLTVEMKINLVAPAEGTALRAEARVIKAGRRITTTEAEVYALKADGREEICAKMLQTMASVTLRKD